MYNMKKITSFPCIKFCIKFQIAKCQYAGPMYDLYQDPILESSITEILIEIYHRIIRAQVRIIIAQAAQETPNHVRNRGDRKKPRSAVSFIEG